MEPHSALVKQSIAGRAGGIIIDGPSHTLCTVAGTAIYEPTHESHLE